MNFGLRPHSALFLFFSLLAAWLPAQDTGPLLLCTRSEAGGEILTWANRPSACGEGTYQATELYRATVRPGPYEVIASLSDSTVTEYRDENPNGEERYYYIKYVTVCGPSEQEVSDTLNSFLPAPPVFRFVSVEANDLVLSWEPSPSPEVTGYVILEVTDAGVIPIDTVGDVTRYQITNVPTGELLDRQYKLATLDPCNNDSPQSRVASATDLTGSGGQGCDSDITLTTIGPDFYAFSSPLIGSVELFVAINGGAFTRAEYTTDPTDGERVVYGSGNDGEALCFYLQQRFSNDSVRTAVYCTTLDINQPVRPFRLYGAEQTDAGRLRLPFENSGNQITPSSYSVEIRNPEGRGETFIDTVGPLFIREELDLFLVEPVEAADSIIITTIDSCGRTYRTNAVKPVFLEAVAGADGASSLTWSPFVNGLEGTFSYGVLYVDLNAGTEELLADVTDLTYIDSEHDSGCYRIMSSFTPADQDTTYSFRSNVACVAGRTEVYLPNVFSPTATQDVNRVFLPVFTNGAGAQDYQLRLFNRWGALFFESDDPLLGWDGTLGGKQAPVGAYVYTLVYRGPTGNLIERSGVVTLLR